MRDRAMLQAKRRGKGAWQGGVARELAFEDDAQALRRESRVLPAAVDFEKPEHTSEHRFAVD